MFTSDVRLQGTGVGKAKLKGKLYKDGIWKDLAVVNMSNLDVSDSIVDDNIYGVDLTGIADIMFADAEGLTQVFVSGFGFYNTGVLPQYFVLNASALDTHILA